jgi:predicted phage terminase large subunit-like protein
MLILDDLIKADEAGSAVARESTMAWFRGTAMSRLDNKSTGKIIVVGQRLHPDDPIGQLNETAVWHQVRLPAIAEETTTHALARVNGAAEHVRQIGEPLDPHREGVTVLDDLRAIMGAAAFNAQYQQRPEYGHDTMVRWPWFGRYETAPEFDFVFLSVDPAIATTLTADWSVCLVMGVLGDDSYVLDVVRHRVGFNDLLLRLDQLATKHRADSILVETGGLGTAVVDELRKQKKHVTWEHVPKEDKERRFLRVLPVIERGRVLLPSQAPWLEDFRMEMLAFPNGHYDDQVDALSQFLWYRGNLIARATPQRIHIAGHQSHSCDADRGQTRGGRPNYYQRWRYY